MATRSDSPEIIDPAEMMNEEPILTNRTLQKLPSAGSRTQYRPRFWYNKPTFAAIIVGEPEERFVVHETLLTSYSDFFRAALTGKFKEAKEKLVKLESENPRTVEFFVHWLYYQCFPDRVPGENHDLLKAWRQVGDHGMRKTDQLVRLYKFSDQYQVPKLGNACIDGLFDHIYVKRRPLPSAEIVHFAFNKLPEKSPLRRLIVDLWCRRIRPLNYGGKNGFEKQDWPKTFLMEVTQRFSELVNNPLSGCLQIMFHEMNLCDYHEHKTDEEKKACKASRKEWK